MVAPFLALSNVKKRQVGSQEFFTFTPKNGLNRQF